MQSLTTFTRRSVLSACAACALLLTVVATGHGADGNTIMHLTFDQAVGLPGAVLPAGQYTFEAIRPDIVRVSSRDGLRVFYTGFTHRVNRPRTLSRDALVSLGEAPVGQPRPITVWYPEWRSTGHQFIYR
jgi:hypothetical protein